MHVLLMLVCGSQCTHAYVMCKDTLKRAVLYSLHVPNYTFFVELIHTFLAIIYPSHSKMANQIMSFYGNPANFDSPSHKVCIVIIIYGSDTGILDFQSTDNAI